MPYMVHSKEVVYLGSKPRLFDNNDKKPKKQLLNPQKTEGILSWGLSRRRSPSNPFGTAHEGPPPIPV